MSKAGVNGASPVTFPNGATLAGSVVYGLEKVRPIHRFLGVPYAQPPERFQPPSPLKLWTGERKATEFGAVCPQHSSHYVRLPLPADIPTNQSEDCLFLNIWTPTLSANAKLPVMFWIHGGSFLFGFSNMYPGTGLCSHHDVVFVSINYRLGPLGFLTTADDVAPGNYGLMDQLEALRWVQKYISLFGGDPENVTLFGNSAGSMSVSMLMMSDASKGLFKRAISQSGTANCPSFLYPQEYVASHVRKQLPDHASASSKDLITYLKSLSAPELVEKMGDQFRPVVDGNILKGFPAKQYGSGAVAPVEYLLGCNTHDVYSYLNATVKQIEGEIATPLLNAIIKILGGTETAEDATKLKEAISLEYLQDVEDGSREEVLPRMQKLYCDAVFVLPLLQTASNHSKIAPTYMYKFMYRPSFCKQYPNWVIADHYMEILYSIGLPLSDDTSIPFTPEEVRLSKLLSAYWVNFAKTGNPNGASVPEWPSYNDKEHKYMVLNAHPAYTSSMWGSQIKFWTEVASKYLRKSS